MTRSGQDAGCPGPKSPRARGGAAPAKAAPEPRAAKATLRAPPVDRLPQTRRSKTEESMARRLSTLDPGSPRHGALAAAIDFKRSWLELAEQLTTIERASDFKAWGYRTFEAYAQHELHLKKDTVSKLLRSYGFLNTYEPRVLEDLEHGSEPVVMPSYQALDVLAEARKNPNLSEQDYRELRDHVFREDPTPAQIRKVVREKAPDALPKTLVDPAERVRKALAIAERLYGMLIELDEPPQRIQQAMEEVVGGLRQMVEE
jgi:hypothetical protein